MRRIIMASITAVVVIAVLAGTLIPVLDDATTTQNTFTNDGLWRMSAFEEGDTWARSDDGAWTYNSDALFDSDTNTSSVLVGDTWLVRGSGQIRADSFASNTTDPTVIVVSSSSIDVDGNTVSNINGYGAKLDGDYLMTDYSTPVYLLGDSEIYATGTTFYGGIMFISHIEGNIDDGVTVSCFNVNGNSATDYTVSNLSINATAVDGYDDLYLLESITWDLTFVNSSSVTQSTSVSYASYVVPYEVTAEKSVHFTDGENAILNAIPVMIIVALLLAIVAMVIRSRMD